MGKSIDTFVFAHGPSLLVYAIPEGSRAFSAIGAGIEHPDTELTDWSHSIFVDGKLVAEGGPYSRHRAGIPMRTVIPEGSKIILLKVDNLVNSAWAYPFFHYSIPWDE